MGGDEGELGVANLDEWNKNRPCERGVFGAAVALSPAGAGCLLGSIPTRGRVSGG